VKKRLRTTKTEIVFYDKSVIEADALVRKEKTTRPFKGNVGELRYRRPVVEDDGLLV